MSPRFRRRAQPPIRQAASSAAPSAALPGRAIAPPIFLSSPSTTSCKTRSIRSRRRRSTSISASSFSASSSHLTALRLRLIQTFAVSVGTSISRAVRFTAAERNRARHAQRTISALRFLPLLGVSINHARVDVARMADETEDNWLSIGELIDRVIARAQQAGRHLSPRRPVCEPLPNEEGPRALGCSRTTQYNCRRCGAATLAGIRGAPGAGRARN